MGDGYKFTGTLIDISDVGAFVYPAAKAEISLYRKMGDQVKGVHGLKVLGVRDLYYRLTFLACSIFVNSLGVRTNNYHPQIMQIKFFMISFYLKMYLKTIQSYLKFSRCLQFGDIEMAMEDISQKIMKNQMLEAKWNKVYEMGDDKNLYMNQNPESRAQPCDGT